ncbi:GGDEF domain-containing protein [Vibrio aestuarianus]|uniref:diguanylate cyclase n=1 Tax=Vibrio aestuarianus TaxID=28171 RepID=A0AAX3UAW4_9VIBR|nr:GGDEF domain-containing protein [Vibrio aestuarianus]WGK84023.1 GGDEF domain-containing protein [Vibrio aestuarianus]
MTKTIVLSYGLEKWLGISHTDKDFRESSFVFISLTVLTSILAFFVYYNTIIVPNQLLAIIQSIGIGLCFLSYFFLWQSRNSKIAATIMVSVMTTISLLFIVGTGHSEFALAFSFLTPIVAIFVLGYKIGSVFSLVNFVIVAYICLTEMHHWLPVSFNTISFIHLTIIYLFLFSIAYFYDSGRKQTMAQLEESNRQLYILSHTDVLTQLFNRRHMEALLQKQHIQWIAIVDIDDFKWINDQCGHDIGDQVLVRTARLLEENIKDVAQVGRWGGEEFLIAFTITDYKTVEYHIQKLHQSIAQHNFGIRRSVTVSSGIALHQEALKTTTFRRADEALYQAKKSGKNCFRVAIGSK